MKELFDAVVVRYKLNDAGTSGPASILRAALGNASVSPITSAGFYPYKAPQNMDMPYVCYSLPAAAPLLYTMGYTELNEARLQFSIWSDKAGSPVEASTIAGYVKDLFDFCCLTISGKTHLYCKRVLEYLLDDKDLGWQYIIQYEIVTEE